VGPEVLVGLVLVFVLTHSSLRLPRASPALRGHTPTCPYRSTVFSPEKHVSGAKPAHPGSHSVEWYAGTRPEHEQESFAAEGALEARNAGRLALDADPDAVVAWRGCRLDR
jgi:hypothetical protein